MKRIISILLLTLLLFNWFGYRLLFSVMESRVNTALEARLDDHRYDESQLILIKIPILHLSYYNSSTTFERVDGQIEVKGVLYKYVKKRLYNDSLEVFCIPNDAAMQLKAAQNEFLRFSNDVQQERRPGSHPEAAKVFFQDQYTVCNAFAMEALPYRPLSTASPFDVSDLASCYCPTAEHPPDLVN